MMLAKQANECRRAGRFGEAEELFEAAHRALPVNVHGLELARVLVIEASLDRDRLAYAAALRKLADAEHVFRLQRGPGGVDLARVALKRAIVLDDMGEHLDAQAQCERVFDLVPREHPLAASAMWCYIESELVVGDRRNARRWFDAIRPAAVLIELDGDALAHRLRVDWLEALLLLAEGRADEARELMLLVAERYTADSNPMHAARVLVDLVDCSLAAGRELEARDAGDLLADLCGALRWREAETAFRLLLARLASRRCSEAVMAAVMTARSRCLSRASDG